MGELYISVLGLVFSLCPTFFVDKGDNKQH